MSNYEILDTISIQELCDLVKTLKNQYPNYSSESFSRGKIHELVVSLPSSEEIVNCSHNCDGVFFKNIKETLKEILYYIDNYDGTGNDFLIRHMGYKKMKPRYKTLVWKDIRDLKNEEIKSASFVIKGLVSISKELEDLNFKKESDLILDYAENLVRSEDARKGINKEAGISDYLRGIGLVGKEYMMATKRIGQFKKLVSEAKNNTQNEIQNAYQQAVNVSNISSRIEQYFKKMLDGKTDQANIDTIIGNINAYTNHTYEIQVVNIIENNMRDIKEMIAQEPDPNVKRLYGQVLLQPIEIGDKEYKFSDLIDFKVQLT